MIAHILEIVGAWIVSVISASGYLGVMLLMAIESACIPLPSEIIMPFSGYLVYTGRFSLLGGGNVGRHGLQSGIGCGLRDRLLRRPPAGRALWPLHLPEQARTRHCRRFFDAAAPSRC